MSENLQCRMYESQYPEVDDLVMVTVRSIAEVGAYVQLLEYNNIEGMILLSELSRRRIRSIQKLIRVGRNEVVVVLRVDKEKGYIDLSKRRVSAEDVQKCEEKFAKSKTVHSIMRHVAEVKNLNLEEFYSQVGWPLYKKFGHAFDAFKLAINEPSTVFQGMNLQEDILEELLKDIKRRLTPQEVKIRSDIEVTCNSYEGIDAIIAALSAAEAESTDEIEIKVKLVAAPLYVVTTKAMDKQSGIDLMEKALTKLDNVIREKGGNLVVKMKPRAINESDEKQLVDLMEKSSLENRETAGDDPESETEM